MNSASSAAPSAAVSAVSALRSSMSARGPVVVFVILTLMLIILILAYIIYRVRRTDLQSVEIVKAPKKLFDMGGPFRFEASKMPATLNGQEFSFSMWLYLTEFTPTTEHKLVFMRGADNSSVLKASPVVALDKNTNKMYVSVLSNLQAGSVNGQTTLPPQDTIDSVLSPSGRYLTATVDYVPLQRWVQYTFVVQDNLLTVYQDGDVYTVENVQDKRTTTERPVFAGIRGDLMVGQITGTASTRGFICNLNFYNYALTQRDVKNVYENGPVSASLLSKIGVPEYGVRSPIYRLDE